MQCARCAEFVDEHADEALMIPQALLQLLYIHGHMNELLEGLCAPRIQRSLFSCKRRGREPREHAPKPAHRPVVHFGFLIGRPRKSWLCGELCRRSHATGRQLWLNRRLRRPDR